MARRISERSQAVLFLLVLATAIAGLYGWAQVSQAPPVSSTQVTGASLLVEGPSWTTRYSPSATTNNTAFGILLEASQRLHFSLDWLNYSMPSGVFVTSINGTVNGQGGMSWQYWVAGVYGDRAANLYPIQNNDVVTWRFTTDQGAAA